MTRHASLDLAEVYPPFGVRITCGPLVLRGITDDDIMPLVEVARRGLHDADEEHSPLSFDWTAAPPQYLAINYARWAWGQRYQFTAKSWILALLVEHDGEVVGVQEGRGEQFARVRSVSTGSWLGRAAQGKGIGTLMRQAFCTFLVDELGALEVTSAAFTDNPASWRVSEKTGYRRLGTHRAARGRESVTDQVMYQLTPDTLVRPPHPLQVEGAEPLRRFLGLDSSAGGTAEQG
ncbi:GNAT family N-acetyltransferase [Propionibacteriaceae bacterium G1746]|uniref:GNAT family N-acetyltransferase n=1 Tax=Aestuariimicrobium sp. G57 TaxID=3418485 RepID=UPI003C1CB329